MYIFNFGSFPLLGAAHLELNDDDEVGEDGAEDAGQRGLVHLKESHGAQWWSFIHQINQLVQLLLTLFRAGPYRRPATAKIFLKSF